MRIKKFNKI